MKKRIFLITNIVCSIMLLVGVFPIFAASTKAVVSYEPVDPNFTSGQQNVVTALVRPASGVISAATLVFQSTGGVKVVNVLDPLDSGNNLLKNTKNIVKNESATSTKVTFLFLRASADLPTEIKVPLVVTGTKAGNVQLDTKNSQIIDAKGDTYTLSQQKAGYITFSQDGKNTLPPPTPTPLSANSVAIHVSIKFQGIKPSEVKTKTISAVKVQLVQRNGTAVQYSLPQFIPVTMDSTGIWHGSAVFPNIKSGKNYALLIKGPKHLQTRICENNATESKAGIYRCSEGKIEITGNNEDINTTGITQMTGDVGIQDGILNSYDLSFVQNIIKRTAQNTATDADMNYDGKIDKTDYDLLIYSFVNTRGQDQR